MLQSEIVVHLGSGDETEYVLRYTNSLLIAVASRAFVNFKIFVIKEGNLVLHVVLMLQSL